jgi:hypothetical protein
MKPTEDIAAGVPAQAPRRPWKAPSARRLATSAAETATATNTDDTEALS